MGLFLPLVQLLELGHVDDTPLSEAIPTSSSLGLQLSYHGEPCPVDVKEIIFLHISSPVNSNTRSTWILVGVGLSAARTSSPRRAGRFFVLTRPHGLPALARNRHTYIFLVIATPPLGADSSWSWETGGKRAHWSFKINEQVNVNDS